MPTLAYQGLWANAPVPRRLSGEGHVMGKPMPSIARVGPYRFFFYAGDRDEPAHVHIEREDKVAKFWLDPIRLQRSGGFPRTEIARIEKLVQVHQQRLLEAWNDYSRG